MSPAEAHCVTIKSSGQNVHITRLSKVKGNLNPLVTRSRYSTNGAGVASPAGRCQGVWSLIGVRCCRRTALGPGVGLTWTSPLGAISTHGGFTPEIAVGKQPLLSAHSSTWGSIVTQSKCGAWDHFLDNAFFKKILFQLHFQGISLSDALPVQQGCAAQRGLQPEN